MGNPAFAAIDDGIEGYRDTLFDLLRQPSISAKDVGVEECADQLAGIMERCGFDVELVPTTTYPLVTGSIGTDPDAPTILFYGHYDVQPAGDEALWDSPPFEPTVRDGSIFARGAGDNKGQLLAHVFAVDALLTAGIDPPVNVRVLAEGEEENGSTGLIEFVDTDPPMLDCDLIFVADGPMHRSRRPTLLYGNRGILAVELTLECANTDLHSGNFGGPVPNAANELVAVLDTLFDEAGVTIEGVGDDVAITDAQRDAVRAMPHDAAAMKHELGLDAFTVPDDAYYERLLLEPNLSINGLRSGYGGAGMKTIVPHEATAKLDLRLVPEQDPDRVLDRLRSHVAAENPDVEVTKLGSFPPMHTPLDTPVAGPVRAALREAWGRDPVEQPLLGGSLPAAYFRRSADVPILVVPYANPDQNNHAPNEHLDLDCFRNGIRTSAAVIERFDRR